MDKKNDDKSNNNESNKNIHERNFIANIHLFKVLKKGAKYVRS